MTTSGVGALPETIITIPVSQNAEKSGSFFGRVITHIKDAKCLDWLLRNDSEQSQTEILRTLITVTCLSIIIFSAFVTAGVSAIVSGATIGAIGVGFIVSSFAITVLSGLSCILLAKHYDQYNHPAKTNEMMNLFLKRHYQHHTFTPELAKRMLGEYLHELDPNKSYFLESEICQWLNPSEALTQSIVEDYQKNEFPVFHEIQETFYKAIKRREGMEAKNLAVSDHIGRLFDVPWADHENELEERLSFLLAYKVEIHLKQKAKGKEVAIKETYESWHKNREEFLHTDVNLREKCVRNQVLKAFAHSLDPHSAFYPPQVYKEITEKEANILCGVGICRIPDGPGYRITKIIDGSPAAEDQKLKVNDLIMAVNGKLDGEISGEEGTTVVLTVLRSVKEGDTIKEEKLDIPIQRRQFSYSRSEFSVEPFQDGVIAYIKLESFFKNKFSSSTLEVVEALKKFKKEHLVKGVILDLRNNHGGLVKEGVKVLGAFISQGVLAVLNSPLEGMNYYRKVKAETHWDGPLVVMIDSLSCSASELVALGLQDYGRALIVGDKNSFGKGCAQYSHDGVSKIHTNGEYELSFALFHTVSGRTPQGIGVESDVVVPGPRSERRIGERFEKYPLANKRIKPMFEDDLSDLDCLERVITRIFYNYAPQQRMNTYEPYLETLKKNSAERMASNPAYQAYLEAYKKPEKIIYESDTESPDFQLIETKEVMKDLLTLMK